MTSCALQFSSFSNQKYREDKWNYYYLYCSPEHRTFKNVNIKSIEKLFLLWPDQCAKLPNINVHVTATTNNLSPFEFPKCYSNDAIKNYFQWLFSIRSLRLFNQICQETNAKTEWSPIDEISCAKMANVNNGVKLSFRMMIMLPMLWNSWTLNRRTHWYIRALISECQFMFGATNFECQTSNVEFTQNFPKICQIKRFWRNVSQKTFL